MARKRSSRNKKNKMASKKTLNSSEEETDLPKKINLEHKLISVTISKKHPEIDISDQKIQKLLLIFNLLIEAKSDKSSNAPEDSEDGIPEILITIAAKLLQLLPNNIDSLKLSDIIKKAFKKIKSFIAKNKKDGANENDSENSIRPETSGSESSSSEARTI